MTKGYFVIEGNGKIRKATYLVSDAYLDKTLYSYCDGNTGAFSKRRNSSCTIFN